jgi:hypothetical protein
MNIFLGGEIGRRVGNLGMKLTKSEQIAVASSAEIRGLLKKWTEEDGASRSYLGGYVSLQAEMNGMIVTLLAMPPEVRRELRHRGLDLMEQLELGKITLDEIEAMGDGAGGNSGDRKVTHGKPVKGKGDAARKRKAT